MYITMPKKITITFAPEFVERHINSEIQDKDTNYICLYQKRERNDGDTEEVYNLWLYKQVGWYIVQESWLKDILEFLKKFGNVQIEECDK